MIRDVKSARYFQIRITDYSFSVNFKSGLQYPDLKSEKTGFLSGFQKKNEKITQFFKNKVDFSYSSYYLRFHLQIIMEINNLKLQKINTSCCLKIFKKSNQIRISFFSNPDFEDFEIRKNRILRIRKNRI